MSPEQELRFEGSALSRGIAIGVPYIIDTVIEKIPDITLPREHIQSEIERYKRALASAKNDLVNLREQLEQEGIKDGASVLESHVQLTEDPLLTTGIADEIAVSCKNAEFVLAKAMRKVSKKFERMQDPFFQQRFEIVQDIYKRVLERLRQGKHNSFSEIPPGSVVFAQTIAPSSAAEANRNTVAAFVTQYGGTMSHMAIVAKARGIPYVANIDFSRLKKLSPQAVVIVDGLLGRIIINPTEKTLAEYQGLQLHMQMKFETLKGTSSLPSETSDGVRIRLSANVEISDEFALLKQYGAEGVGLFRSEYLVLGKGCFPPEDEQYAVYKSLTEYMSGSPVVIRAFDIGMDKIVNGVTSPSQPYSSLKTFGVNPAFGARAIRFLLREKELFYIQVRAILRAAIHGDVRLLFPMVSSVSELREAKEVVFRAYDALLKEGYTLPTTVKVGCMVEVPSAAMISDLLARECDFLSIGTNDLIQYALAIDRTQHATCDLLTSTHPGVVRLVRIIIQQAEQENVPVCVCGEIASDPRFVPLLIGLGITELSVASRFLPLIKYVIRSTSQKKAAELAKEVLGLDTAHAIQELLLHYYQKNIESAFHDFAFT
jgi:phosphotransferase system enzyme I (PtsI)